MMNDDDDFKITIEHAREIAQRVTSADGKSRPLIGKEPDLLEAIFRAQRSHDEALEMDAFRSGHVHHTTKLRKALDKALEALEDSSVNLAYFDPDLDESYINPNSKRDLRGLLRRALIVLDKEVPIVLSRQDQDGKVPRAIRNRPDKISSVGIRAVVEVLYDFWDRETGLPFSDNLEKSLDDRGEDGPSKPSGLAAIFVYETARLIDPGYTAEACSNAMRPR